MNHLKKHVKLYSFIFACMAIYSISFAINLENGSLVISNSVFSLIFLLCFYLIISKGILAANKCNLHFCTIMGLIFSSFLIIGREIYVHSGIDYSAKGMFHKAFLICSLGILFAAVLLIMLDFLSSAAGKVKNIGPGSRLQILAGGRSSVFVIWAFIFLCWLPVFLAFYPGIFAYDVPNQVSQLHFREFTSHHPVLHTLYLGICIGIGKQFHSYNLGVAIYTLSQMAVMSAIFAYTCSKLNRWGAPVWVWVLSILYFALHPLNSMFAVSTTKDVLFTGFLLLLIIFLYEMFREPDIFVHSIFLQARFLVTVILMASFRNNGLYAFLLCIPFILMLQKKRRLRLTLICAAAALAYLLFINILHRGLHVSSGSIAEMLSIPIQQFARVTALHQEELADEDLQALYGYIDEEKLTLYNAYLADPVKDGFNQEAFYENTKGFVKLWARLGLKYPGTYADAFLTCSLGNWYPNMNYPNMHPYMETSVKDVYLDLPFERQSKLPWLEELYGKLAYDTPHQGYPVVSMLFQPAFFSWFLLFAAAYCVHMKNRPGFLALMPLTGLWLTLLLAPIALMRYSYPLAAALPIMIWFMLDKHSCPQPKNAG
jgi:hypothetical protein